MIKFNLQECLGIFYYNDTLFILDNTLRTSATGQGSGKN